ncbi:translesion DNA synthesis-associated protein ImuA (plasmid) [Paraburkholderia sp. D15]|uniref:translesion DNA synthesis-associated protein ImuA n=1 Tax=Paraburkholderia sp. D15 TaxID=2880218 RepID=UPI00247A1A98|nr:translesion DNA synthesis-associated protein ImuA [Paraburkholderia sp. D15]WGS55011.1 translesion DNA synthesis-associated protein ImuA [Paraburkholderia sp. D15]
MYSEAGGITLWRGSQLGGRHTRVVVSGSPQLDAGMPGGGWPRGALTELLVSGHGVGEMRLLRPALAAIADRPVMLLQPPHRLQPAALAAWGLSAEHVRVLHAGKTADALWAAEQILRAGTTGALIFWQNHVRPESLRRLHLAAQTSDTLFFLIRPLAAASDASTAPLRLALRPVRDGVNVEFVKRRGPRRDDTLSVLLSPSPILNVNRNASVDRRSPPATVPRSVPAEVVA